MFVIEQSEHTSMHAGSTGYAALPNFAVGSGLTPLASFHEEPSMPFELSLIQCHEYNEQAR